MELRSSTILLNPVPTWVHPPCARIGSVVHPIADGRPTLLFLMSRHLWRSVSGEKPLMVPAWSHRTLLGIEISEVPRVFPDDEILLVQDAVHRFQICALEFFGEHLRFHGMVARDRIRSIFRQDERFACLFPEGHLLLKRFYRQIQEAGQVVPTVVPVDASHIHRPCGEILGVIVLAADHVNDESKI